MICHLLCAKGVKHWSKHDLIRRFKREEWSYVRTRKEWSYIRKRKEWSYVRMWLDGIWCYPACNATIKDFKSYALISITKLWKEVHAVQHFVSQFSLHHVYQVMFVREWVFCGQLHFTFYAEWIWVLNVTTRNRNVWDHWLKYIFITIVPMLRDARNNVTGKTVVLEKWVASCFLNFFNVQKVDAIFRWGTVKLDQDCFWKI